VARFQAGDIVARRKGLVMHKGLVMQDGSILHNTPSRGEHLSTEREFAAGRRVRVERSTIGPVPELRRRGYHLFRNNCEHTVHRASTGRAHSPQLKAWLAGVGVAAVALVVARHPGAAAAGYALGRRLADSFTSRATNRPLV
jgi:hypothetical protein